MLYRRKTYKILPDNLEKFNWFFHIYLLPNQIKQGAKLTGRWVTDSKDEIIAIWEYKDIEHYHEIESKVRQDELHLKAQLKRKELGELFLESKQDFLSSTGTYL